MNSKGGDVLIVSDGSTLTGYVDAGGGSGYQAAHRPPGLHPDGRWRRLATPSRLIDQIDHPALDWPCRGEPTPSCRPTVGSTSRPSIVAMDGDGDTIGLGAGAFKVQVLDDIPTIVAREAGTETETISFSLSGVAAATIFTRC